MRWTGKRSRPIAFEGDAVFVHASARVDAFAVLDSSHGPVVIDRDAHIGAHAVLQGPVFVGPGTIVAPGALLKARTVLGPRCRAAGEIGGSSESAHASADDDDVRLSHDRADAAQPAEARRPPVAGIRPRSTSKR